ncbi:MAG: STAS/SEC14 domain-containing protein [Planctomycetaceae bacterium]|nr:STAS/SEC14 domain-containing protein [Planctomycetaceae bacterium]
MAVKTNVVSICTKCEGNIIEIKVSGKLCKEDYDVFVLGIENLIATHGRVRMLFDMYDFHGWSVAAVWEDVKFGWKHFRDIERIAMVGEKAWEHGMTSFCKPFTLAKIRYFDRSEETAAREWISEQD